LRDEAGTMQGAARGSSNVWPTDAEWK
jgi:hypothetical protein